MMAMVCLTMPMMTTTVTAFLIILKWTQMGMEFPTISTMTMTTTESQMNWIWMTMVMAFLTMMTSLILMVTEFRILKIWMMITMVSLTPEIWMMMETASRISMKSIPMVMAFQMITVSWNVSWPGFLPFLKMMETMTDTILQDRPKIVAKPTNHSL